MRNQYARQRRRGQSGKWLVGMILVIGFAGLGYLMFFG